MDHSGNLINHNQLTDYWYWGSTLSNINFYDFTCCISLQPNSKIKQDLSSDDHLRNNIKHKILTQHPLAQTHHLVEHITPEYAQNGREVIPRVIGSGIPRQNSCFQWKVFTLAHFKPFSVIHPLITSDSSIEETYKTFLFSEQSQTIMKSWEACHECEDNCDAERLRKRAALTTESIAMTTSINQTSMNFKSKNHDLDMLEISSDSLAKNCALKDFLIISVSKSGPVQFFCCFWTNQNRNRFPLCSKNSQLKPDCWESVPISSQLPTNRSQPVSTATRTVGRSKHKEY
jgi:hypothetical protein